MNLSRDDYHHGDLRNALVSSALRFIEETGHSSFSMREATRDVGVSANAAYRHFEDKSALMTAAATEGFEQLSKRMIKAMSCITKRRTRERHSVARFKAVGRAYIQFAADRPKLFRLMFGEVSAECVGKDPGTPWSILGSALDDLVRDGVLPAEHRPGAELKAWSAVHGFATLGLKGKSMESILDFAVVGLCGSLKKTKKATWNGNRNPHPST